MPPNVVHDPDGLLCAILRHETPDWPSRGNDAAMEQFIEAGRLHGVLPLLHVAFRSTTKFRTWPAEVLEACRQVIMAQFAWELGQRAELDRVLAEFTRLSIKSLLLKGSGLAYALYAHPELRPRTDSDLLIPVESRGSALRTLQRLGYRRFCGPAGELVGFQVGVQRSCPSGTQHYIDLHWRISNAQSFAWLFSFDEMAAEAVPVPSLSPHALRLGNAHALVLCLLHRAGNNVFQSPGFGDRLLWLYDIHLLVGAMRSTELDHFRSMVRARRLGAIALDGLGSCAARFPSPALFALIDELTRGPEATAGADLLTAGRLRREWIEFRAIPGASARLAYLAGRAFPSPEYMREAYPQLAARRLPALHARHWFDRIGKLPRRRC